MEFDYFSEFLTIFCTDSSCVPRLDTILDTTNFHQCNNDFKSSVKAFWTKCDHHCIVLNQLLHECLPNGQYQTLLLKNTFKILGKTDLKCQALILLAKISYFKGNCAALLQQLKHRFNIS